MPHIHTFRLAKGRGELVQKEIKYTRNGKTYTRKQWVRVGESPEAPDKKATEKPGKKDEKKQEKKPEKEKTSAKKDGNELSDEQKKALNDAVKQLEALKPGQTLDTGKTRTEKLQGGFFGVKNGKHKFVVMGAKAAAIIGDYFVRAVADSASLSTGRLEGENTRQVVAESGKLKQAAVSKAEQKARKDEQARKPGEKTAAKADKTAGG